MEVIGHGRFTAEYVNRVIEDGADAEVRGLRNVSGERHFSPRLRLEVEDEDGVLYLTSIAAPHIQFAFVYVSDDCVCGRTIVLRAL